MRFLLKIGFWIIPMILLGAAIVAFEQFLEWGDEDFKTGKNLTLDNLEFSMVVQDRFGKEIYRNFNQENREWLPVQDIPEFLQKATILVEDKRFYEHYGVDFIGITRAMVENAIAGRIVQGGSTLTQQMARKVFLTDERTYTRKLREMFMAFGIESTYTKTEILEMYLNTVPYGPRTNGVAVAANEYFSKNPSNLTEAEMLVIAVMPKDPVRLSRVHNIKDWMGSCSFPVVGGCNPFRDLNYEFSRIESLLFAMAKKESWSQNKTKRVWLELRKTTLPESSAWVNDDFQHFRFYIERFLSENGYDKKDGTTNGLIIQTTLDSELQSDIYAHMRSGISAEMFTEHWIKNYAITILDHESRGPLVWIGSKNFWNSDISGQIDMLRSRRQTGSTIKPFIYAAAIEEGFEPPTIFYDSAISFTQDGSRLGNSDGHFSGGIRMSEALARSRNIPAAKALILAGGESVVKKYLDASFGFDIAKEYQRHYFGWTLALGTAPVKIMDLANAYATLGSVKNEKVCPVLSIKDFEGRYLQNPCNARVSKRIDASTAFFINDILSNSSERPADWNRLLEPNKTMAIKTGTSSKRVSGQIFPVDDIVVGYTPEATVLLWTGNTDGKGLKPGSVSVYSVGPVWKTIANKFLDKYPDKWSEFKRPADLHRVNGEWAHLNYVPPNYDRLTPVVSRNIERGLNPLYQLDHER